MRQTKASKFRGLLPVIEGLLISYTYEGVIYLLEEKHDFKISKDTFSLYLHRERAKAKISNVSQKMVLESVNSPSENIADELTHQVDPLVEKPAIVEEKNTDANDKPYVQPTIEELDAAMEEMKRRQELRKHGLPLD